MDRLQILSGVIQLIQQLNGNTVIQSTSPQQMRKNKSLFPWRLSQEKTKIEAIEVRNIEHKLERFANNGHHKYHIRMRIHLRIIPMLDWNLTSAEIPLVNLQFGVIPLIQMKDGTTVLS